MGGCEVDLAGGEYLISAPLIIPQYNANMNFGFGSLVAAPNFQVCAFTPKLTQRWLRTVTLLPSALCVYRLALPVEVWVR